MADIAHTVTVNNKADLGERLSALELLIRLDDPRLGALTQSLATDPKRWQRRFLDGAVLRLFPNHIGADRLCSILATLGDSTTERDELSWMLPSIVERSSDTPDYLGRTAERRVGKEGVRTVKSRWAPSQ